MKKILLKIRTRWKSETPKLYKRIRNIAVVIFFIVTTMSNIDGAPDWFNSSKWYLLSGSAVIAGMSQLTKRKDKDGYTIISDNHESK